MVTLLALLTLSSLPVAAQNNITVKGQVKNETGQAVPGAAIMLKGAKAGVAADTSGSFTISAPATGTLVFSSVGYATQEVAIQNRAQLSVVLTSISGKLEDVIVVGYGSQRKKDATGAVTSVSGTTLWKYLPRT